MIIDIDVSRLSLGAGERVRLPHAQGASVAVIAGRVWLTQEGDTRDILLTPGDSFEIAGPGLALVQALGEARIALLPPAGRSAPIVRPRLPEARPFRLPGEWDAGVGGWMPTLPRHAV